MYGFRRVSRMAAMVVLIAAPTAGFAAGALVSSPVHGKYYYMTHRASPGVAAQLALSDCIGHFGGGCRLIRAYASGCVAIAQSGNGSGHSGWAIKSSMGAAQAWALAQCDKYGSRCHLDVASCE